MRDVRQWISQGDGGRTAAVAYCVCALYVQCAVSLLAWTVVPVVAGFQPVLIVSGSMGPALNAGDVVLMEDPPDVVNPGAIVMFDDPAHPGRRLTHRAVSQAADGSLTTKGDANPLVDSSPVPVRNVQGVARAVIPAVGAPLIWFRSGSWPLTLGWAIATLLAISVLTMTGRARRPIPSWTGTIEDPAIAGAATPRPPLDRQPWWEPAPQPRGDRRSRRGVAAGATLLALVLVLPQFATAHGAWAEAADNPGNDFLADTEFCTNPGVQTLTPTGDAKVLQLNAATNYGATADLAIDPRVNRAARSLVKFALPAQPSYCLMTATLRVQATAVVPGRTLQALRASAAWNENTVTWNTQPATAGATASALSPAAPGWITFDVSSSVAAMYAGSDNGFVLKDSAEGAGANLDQALSSRTGANPPELVLNFTPIPIRPAAPSSLAATALSDSQVSLSWAENAANEDGLELQRSAGGAGVWTDIATPAPNSTAYTDSGRSPGTTYDYRVRAVNAGGPSPWSNVASVTTNVFPPAPTNVTAGATGVNNIQMTWTDNSDHEVSFRIEASPGSGTETWTLAGTVGANITTFNATGLTANTAYKFRVRAQNAGGDSAWSNVITATTNTCASVATQTLLATADAALLQATPTTALGTTQPTTFLTRARVNENARSLVQFGAPTIPIGCAVATATLRLNVSSQTEARTVRVARANAAWTEAAVTWNTQPAITGTPVPATSAVGWTQWTVTNELIAMLVGSNHGFLVSDASENGGSAVEVNMSSREGANPPQLLVTFGP